MKTNNLKTFTLTLNVEVLARDHDEALDIGKSLKTLLTDPTAICHYKAENVELDRVEEN